MTEYSERFKRYESARGRYEDLQMDIRDFLNRFTGEHDEEESPISMRDLATLEGLRLTRDIAFAEYSLAEAEIIKRLIGQLTVRDGH